VPALEPVKGIRVVATPEALDAARWSGDDVDVIRIAPDEAFAIRATAAEIPGDPHAIVEPEEGFSVASLAADEAAELAAHVDWALPTEPGTLAQGKLAGVPAKLLIGEPTLLIVQTAYADELAEHLR
jgi:hypothetical protein